MEATIGFDLRSTVSDASWTVDRRTRYLLRREVAAVRSVDPIVWVRPPGFPRSPEPAGLWSNLSDLFAAAHALDRARLRHARGGKTGATSSSCAG